MSEYRLLSITNDRFLSKYLNEINKIPILEPEKEYELSQKWQNEGDIEAAQTLVTSHLRLVAKIAIGYKNYGIPIFDLIGEGILGLMHAVKKFDATVGARLATYAAWWIKASIQDYILKYLRIGTSSHQKSLFFNLRKVRSEHLALYGHSADESLDNIALSLNSTRDELCIINEKMSHTLSLNEYVFDDSETELIDSIADPDSDYAEKFLERKDEHYKKTLLKEAMSSLLSERERQIVQDRSTGIILEDLSKKYKISRERVRQIYNKAVDKISNYVKNQYFAVK